MNKLCYCYALSLIFVSCSWTILAEEAKSKSLVPIHGRMDDFEARFNIAKILSRHKTTQEAAARLFSSLLNESQENPDAIIKEIIPVQEPKDQGKQKVKTMVPKNGQVSKFEVELALGRIYSHQKGTWLRALKLYQWLLSEKPDNIDTYIEMGRLYMNLKRLKEALAIFYQGLKIEPENPELLVATAQGEVTLGYAKRARCHFRKALALIQANIDSSVPSPEPKANERLNPAGYDKTLIDYADGMMMWGDFYHAESIFRDAVEKDPESLDFHLKLAWSLASAQRYEEAEEIYKELLLINPDHPKVLLPLARLKFQDKKFDAAMEPIEILLKIDSEKPEYLQLKADILFMQYRYCEAIEFYKAFKNHSEFGSEAYIGIGRSLQKLGKEEKARTVFEEGLTIFPTNIKLKYHLTTQWDEEAILIDFIADPATAAEKLSEWGSVNIQNGFPEKALPFYKAAVMRDPEYFPGMIGWAETLSITYHYNQSILLYQELLNDFPENSKLMLAIARVTGWSKNYDLSIERYYEIICTNPRDPVPYREKARTALWGKMFNLSMDTYDQLLACPVDSLSEYLIQTSIRLEKRAKALVWYKKPIHALDAYQELLEFSPGNEEGLFDYAQVYCGLNLCDFSREVYKTILHLDPSHNLVQQASARNDLKWQAMLQNNISYWREIGSGTFSQSQIARYRLDTAYEYPLTCRSHLRFIQSEYVENPFYNFKFYPAEGQTIEADCVFNEYVSCFVSATHKNYFSEFRSTFTSYNWVSFNFNDHFNLLLSCNKADEIYNYFSLVQAIQSTNSSVMISSNLSHYWRAVGTYQYYLYSDHNHQDHVNLYTDYQFTETPYIFKIIFQGDYRDTAHDTVNILVDEVLIDVVHPYWTPINYYAGSLTLQGRYDYREFVYCEAPQRYIDLKVTGSIDSTDNPGIEVILEWKHDFEKHWGFELKGLVHRSNQWNAEGAWGSLYYRF